jgi:hypothetical protein
MTQDIVPYQQSSANQTGSQVAGLSQAAAGDVFASLQTFPIAHVEATLARQYLKRRPDCTVLSYLRDPGHGTTYAQAAANVLEELADGVEDVSTVTSLVVRYVQAHRLWTDHPNPTINSLEALLGTVDGIQYVQAGTVIGTSSQLMRARALRLIEKHWGTDWFAKIPDDMKDPGWSTAGDCSHQLLRLIAANAKQKISFEVARDAWAESIGRRRDERVRKEMRMRCPRSPFIITDDVRSLNQILDPAKRGRRTTDVFYPEEPAEHQLRVELVTPGSKRSAPSTTAKSGKQKRRRLGSDALNLVHQVENQDDGWRLSEDGRWRLKRVGNQLLRLPVESADTPSDQVANLSSGSRECTPDRIDCASQSVAVTSNRIRCRGPAIASRLRGVAETLAEPTQDPSALTVSKIYCCAQCSLNVGALDEILGEVTRIAAALEAVTGHHIDDSDSTCPPHPESVPATPQLPRNRRWWLSIDSDSDDE